MANRKQTRSVTLVGAGNLAHALAQLLPASGWQVVEIVTRSNPSRAKALARKVGAVASTVAGGSWAGEIVWLAVTDSAIREVGSVLASSGVTNWKGKIVIHSSGALSSYELLPLRRRGAQVASAHPMMTFVAGETPEMTGVVWTVEGDPVAVRSARRVVESLGGRVLKIDPKNKPLYHAFGAFLSPLLVTHLVTASELAMEAGIARKDLADMMKPIVERTVANLFATIDELNGAAKAFSGPLIRGDVETIRKHLQSLQRNSKARALYAALVDAAIAGGLPVKNRNTISKLVHKMA